MKRYLVAHPPTYTDEQRQNLEDKAKSYYGEKEYQICRTVEENQEEIRSFMQKLLQNEVLPNLFLLGMNAMILSQVDSVYFSKDWDSDDMCKMIHMFAFKYGIDIHYESV